MEMLKKLLNHKESQPEMKINRRISPRYRHKQTASLASDGGQAVPIQLDDIAPGGVKFRAETPLKEDGNYVLRLNISERTLLFGVKLLWKKRELGGVRVYGGMFVGPGCQNHPEFKAFLDAYTWKPEIRPLAI